MCNQSRTTSTEAAAATAAAASASVASTVSENDDDDPQRHTLLAMTCGSTTSGGSSSRLSQSLLGGSAEQQGVSARERTAVHRTQPCIFYYNNNMYYFVLGFCVAMVVLTGTALTATYMICKDDVSTRYSIERSPEICCNSITSTTTSKRRRLSSLFSFLFRRNKDTSKQEQASCTTCHVDPKHCACQWMWNSVQQYYFGTKSTIKSESSSVSTSQLIEEAKGEVPQRQKEDFPTAFTPESIAVTPKQRLLIEELAKETRNRVSDLDHRVEKVPWGGPRRKHASYLTTSWWASKAASTTSSRSTTPLQQLDGGNLLYSYLRIMKWPESLDVAYFPFKLCKKNGCPAYFALNHTLTYREVYQPWLVTPSMKAINANGLVYQHGFSPTLDGGDHSTASHAIVWFRPARRNVHGNDDVFYIRTAIRELERAVTLSMQQSKGRVGKFNVLVDGQGFSWSAMPTFNSLKKLVVMLQDHYVDRLGVIILTDMGKICEMIVQFVWPLITEEVRQKIIVVSNHHPAEKLAILNTVLGPNNVPTWLGGKDTYQFDVVKYYESDDVVQGTDEMATAYLHSMPYHA